MLYMTFFCWSKTFLSLFFSSALCEWLLTFFVRFTPSQADVAVFEAVKKAPAAKFVNALRWYNHIASFKIAETKLYVYPILVVVYSFL